MNIAPPVLHHRRPNHYHPHDKDRIAGDIHVVGYRDGERSGASFDAIGALLRRCDGDLMVMGDDVYMQVGGDAVALHLTINRDTVEAITVQDAPTSPAFRTLLFGLLRAGPYVLFRPTQTLGDPGRLVQAGAVTERDVPADITDGLGPLVRVAEAEGLVDYLS